MFNKTEKEIMKDWKGSLDKPIVSICCITYNHERYIKDAIEGFLMQKTNFPIEILIHDDASTDKTPEIIKSYASKYPHLIKPIFQTVNQYSKKEGSINARFVWPKTKGEYIAMCEGDDYWIDPNKLQRQIDELRKHKNYNLCFHLAQKQYNDGKIIAPSLKKSDKIYTFKDIITADFHFVQTNTVVFKKEILNHIDMALFNQSPVGDLWIRIAASMPNGAIFINKVMSVYRVQSLGSWSESMQSGKTFLIFVDRMLKNIDDFDKHWNNKYKKDFQKLKSKFLKAVIFSSDLQVKDKAIFIKNHYDSIDISGMLYWNFIYKYPSVLNILKWVKNKVLKLKK